MSESDTPVIAGKFGSAVGVIKLVVRVCRDVD